MRALYSIPVSLMLSHICGILQDGGVYEGCNGISGLHFGGGSVILLMPDVIFIVCTHTHTHTRSILPAGRENHGRCLEVYTSKNLNFPTLVVATAVCAVPLVRQIHCHIDFFTGSLA